MLKMQVRVCVCVMTVMQAKLSSFQCRNVTCARSRSPWGLSLVFTCCLVRMSRWKRLYKFLYPRCVMLDGWCCRWMIDVVCEAMCDGRGWSQMFNSSRSRLVGVVVVVVGEGVFIAR